MYSPIIKLKNVVHAWYCWRSDEYSVCFSDLLTKAGKCRALSIFLIGQKRINEDTKNLL